MSTQDNQLIAEFNTHGNEDAFAALVRQHINLVFATAFRQVGDCGTAEEIAQNVFVVLAQSCGKLGSHPTIAGWLYHTTLNKSRAWLRSELRRRHREQVAFKLDLARAEGDSVWSPLVPLLDEALLKLSEQDRLAVILHYMEGRAFNEVGTVLGISEDGARKRVSRCLDELALFFRRRGFEVPAVASAAPIFALASHTAPAGLAASATSVAMAAAHAAVSNSALTLIKGALKIMAWTKAKSALVTISAVLLVGGATTGVIFRHTILHGIALARGRSAVARHVAEPINLTGVIAQHGWPAERFDEDNVWAWFPRGFQVFNHVPFQIDGEFSLYGEANAKELHMIFPEHISDIEINQTFESLYLLHNSFYMAPTNTPVYEVVFHYASELTATNDLRFGDDVLGWVVNRKTRPISPTGSHSKLAWVGGAWSATDQSPLRLCMTAIPNPWPHLKVTSIDLYSCKSRCAPCIFAITAGRSELMQ